LEEDPIVDRGETEVMFSDVVNDGLTCSELILHSLLQFLMFSHDKVIVLQNRIPAHEMTEELLGIMTSGRMGNQGSNDRFHVVSGDKQLQTGDDLDLLNQDIPEFPGV
jgi:hypothetical protein